MKCGMKNVEGCIPNNGLRNARRHHGRLHMAGKCYKAQHIQKVVALYSAMWGWGQLICLISLKEHVLISITTKYPCLRTMLSSKEKVV
jgi:hypothetical protein